MQKRRCIGIDPGLQRLGWGVVHIANNVITTKAGEALATRLVYLEEALGQVIDLYQPDIASVEKTFVNKDAVATLKRGQARAMALFAPAARGVLIEEYAPNTVKKTVVGKGHADKQQVQHMVRVLLNLQDLPAADEADALAVALCHAHTRPLAVDTGRFAVGDGAGR